jgi:gentisate 1,2-dioxygenase
MDMWRGDPMMIPQFRRRSLPSSRAVPGEPTGAHGGDYLMRDPHMHLYKRRLASAGFSPGWAKPEPSLWPEPKHDFPVAYFSYSEAKEALRQAAGFVSPADAERRNLICVNPKPGNSYATTRNLVAAYQMVAPGERARSHRHTPNALRLILDVSPETYTTVDGSRIDMSPGDVVLTPSWSWHGHANDGSSEAFWIDFLDVPFVQHTGAMFFEPHPSTFEPITRIEPASPLRISSGNRVAAAGRAQISSWRPIAVGVLPTIGLDLISLTKEHPAPGPKTTANHIYAVIEGTCVVTIEAGKEHKLGRGDLLAVPAWTVHVLATPHAAIVLRVTDAPIMAAANLLRSEAAPVAVFNDVSVPS